MRCTPILNYGAFLLHWLPAAAGKQSVEGTQFIATESHRIPRVRWALKSPKAKGKGWPESLHADARLHQTGEGNQNSCWTVASPVASGRPI
jgi:hypothetical protein